jgi:capping protein beta
MAFLTLLIGRVWFFCARSPWTNQYDPPLDDGTVPSEKLRKLEIDANSAFDQYREM